MDLRADDAAADGDTDNSESYKWRGYTDFDTRDTFSDPGASAHNPTSIPSLPPGPSDRSSSASTVDNNVPPSSGLGLRGSGSGVPSKITTNPILATSTANPSKAPPTCKTVDNNFELESFGDQGRRPSRSVRTLVPSFLETTNNFHSFMFRSESRRRNESMDNESFRYSNQRMSGFSMAGDLPGMMKMASRGLLGLKEDTEADMTTQLINNYLTGNTSDGPPKGRGGNVPIPHAFAKKIHFWYVLIVAGFMGFVLGITALGFINLTEEVPVQWAGNHKFEDIDSTTYYAGKIWWIGVTAGTGLVVGLLRYLLSYPQDLPGLFQEINDCHVDYHHVLPTILLSAISLSGGANLGPEQALVNLGGGLGTFITEKYLNFLEKSDQQLLVLSGMTAALGCLFPSPYLGILIVLELGNPPKGYMENVIVLSFSAICSFVMYFCVVDYTFVHSIPQSYSAHFLSAQWEFENWHIATAFIIGVVSSAMSLCTILIIGICKNIFARLRMRFDPISPFLGQVIPPMVGGAAIGCVNWVLPLTIGSGSMACQKIISYGAQDQLDVHLLVATAFAKLFCLGCSMGCGFVGGFVFPQIMVGIIAGTIMNHYFPYVPYGMCIGCFVAAYPGAIIPAPFTLAGLSIFLFYFGVYQTASILIATTTSYLIFCGSGVMGGLVASAQKRSDSMEGNSKA